MSEKLQKVLSRAGFGSRRQMETWIKAGRIKVDREIAQLGDRVTKEQQIIVDGQSIKYPQQQNVKFLLYHKPIWEICTRSDPEKRPTVFDRLPKLSQGRWIAIGRLDIQTSGLLLFTNDGEWAHRLMHPKSNIEREYVVRVFGRASENKLKRLLQGVMLEDGMAKFQAIHYVSGERMNHWYRVILSEGRNRIVRRLWEHEGVKVNRLIRVRFGKVFLPKKLPPGSWQTISIDKLRLTKMSTGSRSRLG